jgi:hypothetical protein
MAEPSEVQPEPELARRRAATLRALRYLQSQMESVEEHSSCLRQQIHDLEQDLEGTGTKHRRAA